MMSFTMTVFFRMPDRTSRIFNLCSVKQVPYQFVVFGTTKTKKALHYCAKPVVKRPRKKLYFLLFFLSVTNLEAVVNI
jgi:hypothetical protein